MAIQRKIVVPIYDNTFILSLNNKKNKEKRVEFFSPHSVNKKNMKVNHSVFELNNKIVLG